MAPPPSSTSLWSTATATTSAGPSKPPRFSSPKPASPASLSTLGLGGSDGLRAFVPDVGLVVNDCKKIVADVNPARYRGKPRLAAVVELLRVTQYVSEGLLDVSLPFIVLHGSADVGTDPEVSRALYAAAKSEDKTLKIYEGMMHSLLFGEIDENVEVVRRDILGWLNHRCGGGGKRDE
ncbi:hypothetical protein ACFX19_037445 [Malus domestica]